MKKQFFAIVLLASCVGSMYAIDHADGKELVKISESQKAEALLTGPDKTFDECGLFRAPIAGGAEGDDLLPLSISIGGLRKAHFNGVNKSQSAEQNSKKITKKLEFDNSHLGVSIITVGAVLGLQWFRSNK
jgi:hypothetical protein